VTGSRSVPRPRSDDARRKLEEALARPESEKHYVLRLYVSARMPRSAQAIATLTALCREHLAGRVDLEVIDVDADPKVAQREQIFALPTLVKELPEPLRRFVGDLADPSRVLLGLDVETRSVS
jgi:circadian clock protein KaiB